MKLRSFILLLSATLLLWNADAKEYPVYKISRVPEIDGKLDDHA